MIHLAALFSSILSFGLICAIYACNVLTPRGHWLRAEWAQAILLSCLVGFFPIALSASIAGLLGAFVGGVTLSAIAAAGSDLFSLAATIATAVLFRATVKAARREIAVASNVTPMTPRPAGPQTGPSVHMKKAA